MLSYFLALATRPALWMAETLAKAFFRKSGRVAHAASTALAWFLKMPLLFAPFNVEDGVFVPANSWMSIVVLLAIPTQKEYHHALVGCCRVSTSSEKKNWEKEGAPSKKLGLFLKKNHLVLAKRVRLLANELNRSSPPHCNLAGFFDRLVLKRNAFFLVSFRVAGVPFHFFSFLLLLPNSSKKRKQKKKGKNQSIKKKEICVAPELLNPCFDVTFPLSAEKRVRFTDARTYALFFFTHCHTSSEEHSTCDFTIVIILSSAALSFFLSRFFFVFSLSFPVIKMIKINFLVVLFL